LNRVPSINEHPWLWAAKLKSMPSSKLRLPAQC
jgi:hypothetical protein